MKKILLLSVMACFGLASCGLFNFQDTDYCILGGLKELTTVIDKNGNIMPVGEDTLFPPYIYKGNLHESANYTRVDSIYFLKNKTGDIMDKWEIKLINYDKSTDRGEYQLSNGKYLFVDCDKNLVYSVSEQVDKESMLKKKLSIGKYVYSDAKPTGW